MSNTEIPEQAWAMIRQHLKYTDEEWELFKDNPRNAKVLAAIPRLMNKTIVFEVLESHGCNSQHVVGTRFFFSADGNLITKMAPKRMCAFSMPVMTMAIQGMHELIYAGVDPNEACFRRGACHDIGVGCGGWGRIVVEASVMSRDEAEALYSQSQAA